MRQLVREHKHQFRLVVQRQQQAEPEPQQALADQVGLRRTPIQHIQPHRTSVDRIDAPHEIG